MCVYMFVCMCVRTYIDVFMCVHMCAQIPSSYGFATVSRIDKIVGLFCRIASLL